MCIIKRIEICIKCCTKVCTKCMYIKLSKLLNFISNINIIRIDQLNVMLFERNIVSIFVITQNEGKLSLLCRNVGSYIN